MVLVVDPQLAGISGDMFLCSLVGLGADRERIAAGIRRCGGPGIEGIDFGRVRRGGIEAFQMALELGGDAGERSGAEMRGAVRDAAADLRLTDAARRFAASCIDALVISESRVHGIPEGSVHLHEAGGADTIADIVGAAMAMDDLGLFGERIVCMPVAVGGGTVDFSHGTMSNPAGAILEILRGSGAVIRGGPGGAELATPTGACIIASLGAEHAAFYPAMTVEAVGYGAGARESSVLKVVRGRDVTGTDSVTILETNVDDVTGEVLGGLVEKLMAAGARDASIFPGITKKGRPSNLVSVMCDRARADELAGIIISETGTLGVRVSESARLVAERTERRATVEVGGKRFEISYKVSEFMGRRGLKIGFDDIARVSAETGMPAREAESLLRREIGRQS